MDYDIFNGDADGICALHQLRLQEPRPEATMITGVKRDINLLNQIKDSSPNRLTVLDISLDRNRNSLEEQLLAGAKVLYIDHHFAGEIPDHANLTTHIDPAAEICTSLIVDQLVDGRFRAWAVAAAFGDNLHDAARAAASGLNLSQNQLNQLRELGELLNYNGYGATLSDLYFHPAALYQALQPYEDPFDFLNSAPELQTLRQGYQEDMLLAAKQEETTLPTIGRIYHFPDAPWARRVAGVFSNLKAREKKDLAHALVTANPDQTLRISVRAPLNKRENADTLCRAFPTGGGRSAAAGINNLPPELLNKFLISFEHTFARS
ncbi:MAG: acetyltransferase [Desulfobulbaceae bacterium]|uniref:Acetyltransferase n=1 Tax=Candidatus Desulfatifera sulfidica TaxID=2841691 RepID=A0A8J6TA26_9BACT|nr:acetyltransferase [Candidatus Desulfatifera sulfidica]